MMTTVLNYIMKQRLAAILSNMPTAAIISDEKLNMVAINVSSRSALRLLLSVKHLENRKVSMVARALEMLLPRKAALNK